MQLATNLIIQNANPIIHMKRFRNVLVASFGVFATMSIINAQILINEVRTDQSGTDNDEYFELVGTPGASLDGLTYLVLGDGTGGSGVIESVTDLTGHSLSISGFFLVGESTMTLGTPDLNVGFTLNFENSDNLTHLLVSGFTGINGDDLDTDDDGVLDVLPWTLVLDAVGMIEEPNPPSNTEYSYATALGGVDVGPDGSFVPGHIYRLPDGGAWNIGIFDQIVGVDTPGVTNVPEPSTVAAILGLFALGYVMYRRRK